MRPSIVPSQRSVNIAFLRLMLVVGLALGLVACASLRATRALPADLPTAWEARRNALQSWREFDSHGRVAVASAGEGFSGSWRWAQRAERSSLELNGPIGVGGLRVEFGTDRKADASSRLALEQQLGFSLPVDSLRYWMLGVPDPRGVAEERLAADASRLEGLRQDGWTVAFTRYARVSGADYELPQRIDVTRDALRVRLVIEGWGGGVR